MDDEAAVAASADLDFSMPDEMLDYEEAGQIEPAAYDGSPPSRFVAEATKLSRSCHHTSSLLLLLESAAAAGGHPQASMQHSMIDSLYKRNALQIETALLHNQARAAVALDKLLFAAYLTSLTQLQYNPSRTCIPFQCQPRVLAGLSSMSSALLAEACSSDLHKQP